MRREREIRFVDRLAQFSSPVHSARFQAAPSQIVFDFCNFFCRRFFSARACQGEAFFETLASLLDTPKSLVEYPEQHLREKAFGESFRAAVEPVEIGGNDIGKSYAVVVVLLGNGVGVTQDVERLEGIHLGRIRGQVQFVGVSEKVKGIAMRNLVCNIGETSPTSSVLGITVLGGSERLV